MECPKCNSIHLFVKDSRKVNGTTKRRRVCTKCKHTFTTYELTSQEYKRIQSAKKALATLSGML